MTGSRVTVWPLANAEHEVLGSGAIVVMGLALLPVWRPVNADTRTPVAVLTDAPPGVTAALRDAVEGRRDGTPDRSSFPRNGSYIQHQSRGTS